MCGLSEFFHDGNKTDECDDVARWAKEKGLLVPADEGRRGDIVIYSRHGKESGAYVFQKSFRYPVFTKSFRISIM